MTSISDDSSTHLYEPTLSPGSSVSTQLQEEYDELLKYAVVVPSFDPNAMSRTLADRLGSFPQPLNVGRMELIDSREFERDDDNDHDEDEDTEVEDQSQADADGEAGHRHNSQEPPMMPKEQRVAFSTENSGSMDDIDSLTGEHIGSGPSGRTLARLSNMPMGDPLATKLFLRPEPDSSRASVSGYSDVVESEASYSISIDQDLSRMEGLLDTWTANLKRNIMAEFGQAKIKLIGHHKQQSQRLKEKHASDIQRIQSDMDSLRELLHTYEQSIERKDQVIANLTRALQKQREKFDMMRTFSEWKIKHNENKHECMASKLAEKHYHRSLVHKCWDAWHAVIQSRWRERVEKACQAKAQEVCMQLTNDYEAKIASLNEALEAARSEVSRLHMERENYGETMKKAFMRGVCALNLEAMSMFQDQEGRDLAKNGAVPPDQQMPIQADVPMEDFFRVTIPQEPVYSSDPPGAPPPRVVTSQAASRAPIVGSKAITSQTKTSGKTKSKVISAKISAQGEQRGATSLGGAPGLAPPMSSVVVERHQPVVKQTVGHATASRYVRASDSISGSQVGGNKPVIIQRKIAGQAAPNQNIQTVKLVE